MYTGKRSFWKKRFDRCLLELFKTFFSPLELIMKQPSFIKSTSAVTIIYGVRNENMNMLYTRAAHLVLGLFAKTIGQLHFIWAGHYGEDDPSVYLAYFKKIFIKRIIFLWCSLNNEKWIKDVRSGGDLADSFEVSLMKQDKFFYQRLMKYHEQYVCWLKLDTYKKHRLSLRKRRRLD